MAKQYLLFASPNVCKTYEKTGNLPKENKNQSVYYAYCFDRDNVLIPLDNMRRYGCCMEINEHQYMNISNPDLIEFTYSIENQIQRSSFSYGTIWAKDKEEAFNLIKSKLTKEIDKINKAIAPIGKSIDIDASKIEIIERQQIKTLF